MALNRQHTWKFKAENTSTPANHSLNIGVRERRKCRLRAKIAIGVLDRSGRFWPPCIHSFRPSLRILQCPKLPMIQKSYESFSHPAGLSMFFHKMTPERLHYRSGTSTSAGQIVDVRISKTPPSFALCISHLSLLWFVALDLSTCCPQFRWPESVKLASQLPEKSS